MLLFETAIVIIQQTIYKQTIMQAHSLGSQNKTLAINLKACSTQTI